MSFDFWASAKREISLLRLVNTGKNISSQVILPALIATWTGFSSSLLEINAIMFWGFLVTLSLAQIILFTFSVNSPFAAEAYIQAARLDDQAKLLRKELRRMTAAQTLTFTWPFMEREYAKRDLHGIGDLQEICAEMLAPVVNGRDAHFGIVAGEIWSFTIYLFDTQTGRLRPVWREKSKVHPSSGPTREWLPGHGHVGMAFAKKETIIDPGNSDESELMLPPKDMARPYDRAAYRAFAAIPIGGGSHDEKNGETACVGVLVATSDVQGRFDKSNAFLLRHLASTLANVFERATIDSRKVWQEE